MQRNNMPELGKQSMKSLEEKVPPGKTNKMSVEEGKQLWYDTFNKHLGEKPENTGEGSEEIQRVLTELGIADDLFTLEEYRKARVSIKEGKSLPTDEGIVHRTLKRCDFDDIIRNSCQVGNLDFGRTSFMNPF